MDIKFEKVSRFADVDLPMPERKTAQSAGYDFVVAEDVIVDPWLYHSKNIMNEYGRLYDEIEPISLDEITKITKTVKAKPTLVSTGMKCKMESNQYLQLSVRSSCPLKNWLIMANSVGIIDADYYNNPDNEGEIFFQIINLSPLPIYLKKGDRIGQGIIMNYNITSDDKATGNRTGGMGSTGV